MLIIVQLITQYKCVLFTQVVGRVIVVMVVGARGDEATLDARRARAEEGAVHLSIDHSKVH